MMTSSSRSALSSNSPFIPPRPISMPRAPPPKRDASSLRSSVIQLTVDGFGHQGVHRAGSCVDEARPAGQEEPIPKVDTQEIDRRIEEQFEPRGLPPHLQPLLGLEPRIDDFLLHLLAQRQRTFMAQQALARNRRLALVGDEAFVHNERRVEPGAASPDETQ